MGAVRPNVQLVTHTPDPERVIALAAKLCYAEDVHGLFSLAKGQEGRFIKLLRDMGHLSPIEHASFTFFIEGVSRAMTHQLVRHRIASYSQRSQRYVPHSHFDYVIPPSLEGKVVSLEGRQIDAVEYFRQTMELLSERYRHLNEALGASGEGSQQDARYILPNACETKMFVTMNARELLHFFEQRLCLRAQWEIRSVADEMLCLVKVVCPSVFEGAGPKCVRLGKCPEGRMSCGRFEEQRRRYAVSGDR